MDATGALKWWSRLYQETAANSSPDQYVDGLALDDSVPAEQSSLVVLARCHGNNTVNLWAGSSISPDRSPGNPGYSFQNGFTGNSGNIHISWLGKLHVADGTLRYATYVAEYAEGTTRLGTAYTDPNLDGWPSHNSGSPDLNTTRLQTDVHVDQQGNIYVLGVGRRTITTANAYQKMLKPGAGVSAWNSFARVYSPDLTTLRYSSLVVGAWNGADGTGGDNTALRGIYPIENGLLAVGYHTADTAGVAKGAPVPTGNVPAWGAATPSGETALLAALHWDAPAILDQHSYLPLVQR